MNSEPQAPENKIDGLTDEQYKTAVDILISCGIGEDFTANYDQYLYFDGEKGYRISFDYVDDIFLYILDGEVTEVSYAGNILYKDGEVLDNINNYVMTDDEEIQYQNATERMVKSVLVAPSTAEFCGILEYRFGKNNDIITVQGYVDSQNVFGAMLRSDFQAQFEGSTPISLIIDGTEYLQ